MNVSLSCVAALATTAVLSAQQPTNFFERISSFGVNGGIAEIVDASADGNTLAFSDADAGRIGFIDITDPLNPVALPDVATGGEPTSVSISGNIAVAAVLTTPWSEGNPAPDPTDPANAGALFVIDISNPQNPTVLGQIAIGFQPDSVKLTRVGRRLVAVVCIENEPIVVDSNEIVLDEDIPGFPTSGPNFPQDRSEPGFVQVITINTRDVANSNIADVAFPEMGLTRAGALFAADPQPEFVDVNGTTAAISLQENNVIAILDISRPRNPSLTRVFSCGNAAERMADLTEDDDIIANQGYPSSIGTSLPAPTDGSGNPVPGGPRQPDAIAFSPDGTTILSADEGELNFTGGRGWSAFGVDGSVVYEDAGDLEDISRIFGQYPEGRSENRGMEIEGVETATFGHQDFAFIVSERGSFIGVYEIDDLSNPKLVQVLPTGISPEGVIAIPQRNLLVTAEEESGTVTIFEGRTNRPLDRDEPQLFSLSQPFSAISGLAAFGNGAFTVPDNALPTRIGYVPFGAPFAPHIPVLPVTIDGAQARYDGEGITVDRSIIAPFGGLFGGFLLASEGNGSSRPNLIVQTDFFGRVIREIQLPANIDAAADPNIGGNAVGSSAGTTIRGNGFEGVTLSNDGRYLYACIQREFSSETDTHTRIARYDLRQIRNGSAPRDGKRFGGDWDFFFYPLEAQTTGDWIGLSEIITLPNGNFLVIERDKGIGADSQLKTVTAFSLNGLRPDSDGQPGEARGNDTVTKRLVVDVLAEFFPYEKIEGLALVGDSLWISLDNDGGEVENRFVRFPLGGRPGRR